MKALKSLAISFLISLLTSCNSSEQGGASSAITTDFKITASGMNATVSRSWFFADAYALTPPPLMDSNLANVDLLEAWIVVKKIHFFRSADPNAQPTTEDQYQGPFFVDLLDGTPEPFGQIRLYPDGLRRVKMMLHKSNSIPAGAPAGLAGNSMYFRGQVNGHAFSFASDDTADFQVYGANAIFPANGTSLMMTIRIANLIKKIDLAAITADTDISAANRVNAADPCPLIKSGATNLYTCFRLGLNQEAKFGRDDGDDDLDDSEIVHD